MPATTIDEVIAALDQIIAEARREGSRLGYFPALYRRVTRQVLIDLAQGRFEDGPRLAELDVVFANRYLEAMDRFRGGQSTSRAWAVAFEAARDSRPLVLQHLLLAMNAHINLDLGVAAAQVCPGDRLADLQGDFLKINALLGSLVQEVKDELSQIWPGLRWLDRLSGEADDVIVNFSLAKARDQAWRLAQTLAYLEGPAWERQINQVDAWAAAFARLIWRPPPRLRALSWLVRLSERGSTAQITDILNRRPA